MQTTGGTELHTLQVVEFSDDGFLANSKDILLTNVWGEATIRLGSNERSVVRAKVVRGKHRGNYGFYGFKVSDPDLPWRKLVGVLKAGTTHGDLDYASRFLAD